MKLSRPARGICLALLLATLAGTVPHAVADSWSPPTRETTLSADRAFRVTIVPRVVGVKVFDEEHDAAGDDSARRTATAKVERRGSAGTWKLVWRKPLVNEIAPTRALLSRDGKRLVTFDNWGSVGYGDDVVVIYDERGDLVRKLSLEQILPLAYVSHLPRSVSSRWWGREHRLVDEDRFVELQVVEPGNDTHAPGPSVPLRIRLADGAVEPGSGEAWGRAMAKAKALQAVRQKRWDEFRAMRARPLAVPGSADTEAWQLFLRELHDRIQQEGEGWGRPMVLSAPGQDAGHNRASDISNAIKNYDATGKYQDRLMLFASPTSDRLAALLESALAARRDGSLRGLRIVFVGTPEEGRRIAQAARGMSADLVLLDATQPQPAGRLLPDQPPSDWEPVE